MKYKLCLAITQYWIVDTTADNETEAEVKAFALQREYQNKINEQLPPPDNMVLEDWENSLDDISPEKDEAK